MSALVIPEVIIYKTIRSFLDLMISNHTTASNNATAASVAWLIAHPGDNPGALIAYNNIIKDSLIWQAFKVDENSLNIDIETFNYYDQAVEIFMEKEIRIFIGYNLQTTHPLSIHIMLPSDQGMSLNIGASEGYQQYQQLSNGTQLAPTYSFMSDTTFNLVISGVNSSEVVLIYHLLKALLLSLYAHLELAGLRDPKFGGQDINFQTDLIPPNVFHRSINLNFKYETIIPSLFYSAIITGVQITPTPNSAP